MMRIKTTGVCVCWCNYHVIKKNGASTLKVATVVSRAGLVWGPAVQRFGSKKCLIIGCLFVGVGYVISIPMGSVYALLFTYGLLPGAYVC